MIFYVLKYIISYCYFEHKSNNTVIIILDHWWISVSFCSQTAFHQWCIQPILSYELYVTWLPQNKRNLSFSVANRNRLTSLVVCSPINDPKMNTGHLLEGIAGGNIFFIEHGIKRNDIISLFPLNSLSWVKYINFLWTYSWSLRGLMIISYVECTDHGGHGISIPAFTVICVTCIDFIVYVLIVLNSVLFLALQSGFFST